MIAEARLWPANPGWAPPTLQIPGDTFTDRHYQRVELFARGSIDPMKSQTSIAHGRKNAINKQHMKMQVLHSVPSQNSGSMSPHLYEPAIS